MTTPTYNWHSDLIDRILAMRESKPFSLPIEIAPKDTVVHLDWDDAVLYCENLNVDGKTGWRLPTIQELQEMFYASCEFNDFERNWYCTSSKYVSGYAWAHVFGDSWPRGHQQKFKSHHWVRAVRDL